MAYMENIARALAETAQDCHRRGWAPGTSGNYSALISRAPFRLAVSPSGVNKGALTPGQIVVVDESGRTIEGSGRPSDETKLHLAVIRGLGAGSVLHTHSVWNTIVSERFAAAGKVNLTGYEMIKVLNRNYSHESKTALPVFENSQDYDRLSADLEKYFKENPAAHGFLLRRHGLYAWGKDPEDALRKVEAFEFLLEVIGRLDEKH